MKVPSSIALVVSIHSVPSCLLPWATSDPVLTGFLQCLPKQSQPTYPIFEAIFTHDNTLFQSVLQHYIRNSRFLTPTTPKPLAIVAAKHESHVQATVICVKQHGLQIRLRSGGHDYEGLSYASAVPFVILDMFNLRAIDVNLADESAWVQSGATLGELYYEIANKSEVHGFTAGACLTVGAGGHFSGSGYGPMMRKYGLTVDNIEDAKLVNVKGTILDRKSMGDDLFWAIRGGEQGATDVAYKWQYVAPKLPDNIVIRAQPIVISNKGKKTVKVSFIRLFLGQSDKLLPLMNESFPELGLQQKDCFQMSWIESTVLWGNYPVGTPINVLLERPNGSVFFFKVKSDYVKESIPKQGLESLWQMMLKVEKVMLQWNPYGGRMSQFSESDTPFPHRAGNLFLIHYWIHWSEEGSEIANKYIDLSRKLYEGMAPIVSKSPREAFQNYRDPDIGANLPNKTSFQTAEVFGRKYFRGNFDRLAKQHLSASKHLMIGLVWVLTS
ncbi:hypothetical protein C1H46_027780 [Malus baccata]|uniref:FAD-binding PCMH-type domain-containing protein n=1 Tax=Malus baccata TaxID=106549 RepID=A0A540LJL8_MALBA|nr:hypothetical protein C1H46_027780 [Malus baccata]